MRFVIQRVSHAQVTIDGQVRGSIQKGYMVLIGIGQEDTEALADRMIAKMLDLRIFEDEKILLEWEAKQNEITEKENAMLQKTKVNFHSMDSEVTV